MLANIDWDAVKWSSIAIAVILLMITPLFWWLYDSDCVTRYWQAIGSLIWACLSIERGVTFFASGEWWWAAVVVALSIFLTIAGIREFKRVRGRIHADATPL